MTAPGVALRCLLPKGTDQDQAARVETDDGASALEKVICRSAASPISGCAAKLL